MYKKVPRKYENTKKNLRNSEGTLQGGQLTALNNFLLLHSCVWIKRSHSRFLGLMRSRGYSRETGYTRLQ